MNGDFHFAQARMHARHGQRPDPAQWSAGLGHFLESARATGLRRWVADLRPEQEAVELEAALRARYADAAREVGRWVPSPWGAWIASIGELPALLIDPSAADQEGLALWGARWRALRPPIRPHHRPGLAAAEALVRRHRAAMASPEVDALLARAALARDAARLFRRHAAEPASALCHLVLLALDVERLRGGLVRRRLFPDLPPPAPPC
jgi:hypothetical protein